jgi:hypothetical protein
MSIEKPIALYKKGSHSPLVEGLGCMLIIVQHPRQHDPSRTITPGYTVYTSKVVNFDLESGIIETNNTLYHPVD